MNELLANIKEVQEGGKRLANWYLEHGYVLLDIQSGSRAGKFPEENRVSQQYYVRRNPVYVLGRPEGVEPAPFPNRSELTREDSKTDNGQEVAEDRKG